jgi:divalent metal cation (Fe/Co/Zn/Cd) transporter
VTETPVPVGAGLSARRDRIWGLVGGLLGVAVGVGSAAIAVFVEGADPLASSAPYPAFFAKRQLLAYDVFLAFVIFVGAAFAVTGIVLTRRSAFPRTDALGTLLVSAILTVLGGALLFTRLIAVIRGV